MKISLTRLHLTNFKGIKSLEVNFGDYTSIAGANATGKSTIADAFTWLLFGKDTNDRKDFEVKTLDKSGSVIPRIDHEVTGELLIDTIVVTLKRTLREKWVKQRGSSEQVFTGNETLYFVNDVPKSQAEYQNYISQIVPEATFKLLTSPTYFNSIKWQDRRAMLTAIATIPDDETIAGKDLAGLLKIMRDEKKTLSDLKKEYSSKKAKLKSALEQIPARLDEVDRGTPQAEDFPAIEKRIAELNISIADIEAQMADRSKSMEASAKIKSHILQIKSEIETEISGLQMQAQKDFLQQSGVKENKIASLENVIKNKRMMVAENDALSKTFASKIVSLTEANNVLRAKYIEINGQAFDGNGINDTCPTCKQHLPEGDIEQQRMALVANFTAEKANKVIEINKKGVANKAEMESAQKHIQDLTVEAEALKIDIQNCLLQIEDIKTTPSGLQNPETVLSKNPEYIKLTDDLAALVIPEVKEADTSDLRMAKIEAKTQLETLQAAMLKKATIAAMNRRKSELMKEEETLSQELAEMEGFEFQITEFTNRKMKAVEDSVNGMFPSVKFKMFDQQINGGIAETCETMIGGVPYADANNAGRINAGLEIISVFSQQNDTYAPVFVDNAEAANALYPIESQLVALFVTTDKELIIKAN